MSKTKELYELYQEISWKELDKAISETVNQKDEQDFYLALTNYRMASRQMVIIGERPLTYKGYEGYVNMDYSTNRLRGVVEGVDNLRFDGDDYSEVKESFQHAINNFLNSKD